MRYIATMNTPGYMPWSDDPPPVFGTPTEAWEYLLEERARQEDSVEFPDVYSDTYNELKLRHLSESDPDTVRGDTPGYDGLHDLGVSYSVSQVPRVSARCGCCGDDVAVMDEGFCCDDCDTAGCEPSEDACGETAYTECQRTDSLADTDEPEHATTCTEDPCDCMCTCERIAGSLEYTKCAFCASLERMCRDQTD